MPPVGHCVCHFHVPTNHFTIEERDDVKMCCFSSPTHPLCSFGPTQIHHHPEAEAHVLEVDATPAPLRPSAMPPLPVTPKATVACRSCVALRSPPMKCCTRGQRCCLIQAPSRAQSRATTLYCPHAPGDHHPCLPSPPSPLHTRSPQLTSAHLHLPLENALLSWRW
jgi:hypothetical protein